MARKEHLRDVRQGTVINATSRQQEQDITKALAVVVQYLLDEFEGRVVIAHERRWYLKDVVAELQVSFPEQEFHYHFDGSYIMPDGGILRLEGTLQDQSVYPILIAEVKNQGTNDQRAKEGLPRQARGNAIERLGKNLIGLRTALLRESIFPFVCFGYGCDFEPTSSILDRVSTMAMFGKLNTTYLHNEEGGRINRGSFYFREDKWSVEEMAQVMKDISKRSVLYYLSKYGDGHFRRDTYKNTP